MGMILPQDKLLVLTWDRLGICMGGAIGDEIEILVWLLLLPSWLSKYIYLVAHLDHLFMYHLVSALHQERDKYKYSNELGKMCPVPL